MPLGHDDLLHVGSPSGQSLLYQKISTRTLPINYTHQFSDASFSSRYWARLTEWRILAEWTWVHVFAWQLWSLQLKLPYNGFKTIYIHALEARWHWQVTLDPTAKAVHEHLMNDSVNPLLISKVSKWLRQPFHFQSKLLLLGFFLLHASQPVVSDIVQKRY